MSNNLLFSILLANYNNAAFLDDCLKSIYAQTYQNWEIIFIDDCSRDNSLQIIGNYAEKDKRIKVFTNETNMGCGFTKARCARLASGEICGFLDPDDAITPGALEVMVQKHLEHPEAALIYSRRFFCDKKLTVFDVSEDTAGQFISQLATPLISHFVSFKKKIYDKTAGIDTRMKRAVDQDLYLKLEEQGHVIFIPNVLYLYRHHNNSISLGGNEYKAQAWHIYANGNACERRNLSLDDYCDIIKTKPGKFRRLILKLLDFLHQKKIKIESGKRLRVLSADEKYFAIRP
jgi:glycosyltransferase involved in cell wall biosynthesis